MKIEINKPKKMTKERERFVNFHSLLNILNIIHSSVSYLEQKYDTQDILAPSKDVCKKLIKSLGELSNPNFNFTLFDGDKILLKDNIKQAVITFPELKKDEIFFSYIENLDVIFDVLDIRVKEAVKILEDPKQWIQSSKKEIITCLGQFLKAVEKNSLRKYKIAYNTTRENANDYEVNFKIDGFDNENFKIPILLNDVIRDTVSNSRKYSKNGGIINVQLSKSDNKMIYTVEDFGIGIAEGEIQKIFEFGERGNNTTGIKTFGGGIGLTKVAMAINYLSGKMWVKSRLNEGTTITIEIPVPVDI